LGTRFTAIRKFHLVQRTAADAVAERRSSSPFTVNFRVTYWPWTKRKSSLLGGDGETDHDAIGGLLVNPGYF
jgi:hypothetical protein